MAADSGQKTEKPTPKRRREARQKGQIPRSVDLVQWVSLLIATFIVPTVLENVVRTAGENMITMVELSASGEPAPALAAVASACLAAAFGLAPLFVFVVAFAVIGLAVQGGLVLTGDPIKPKWERISPKAGLKRLFSVASLVESGKAVLRLTVLCVLVATTLFAAARDHLVNSGFGLRTSSAMLIDQTVLLLRLAALIGSVIGLADYAFQRWQSTKKLMMSNQEIKQEYKSSDGDPALKNRRRAAHAKLSRNQMLTAVRDATVVVVNPTHYSVALRYTNNGGAPTVVAKGTEVLAWRIRERAKLSDVPIIEAPPLARALHAATDVGDAVPEEFFEAVAVVLAFVMRPRAHRSQGVRRVHVPNSKIPALAAAAPE